jgi:hypothetical protein
VAVIVLYKPDQGWRRERLGPYVEKIVGFSSLMEMRNALSY